MNRTTRRSAPGPQEFPAPRPGTVESGRRPPALLVLCALVGLQAVALLGLAGVWVAELVRGATRLPAASVFLVLFAVGLAVALGLCVRGLWGGRRWARSPVMTWQVLLVVMAVGWWGSDPAPWVVAVLLSAVAVGVGLVLPPVVAATVDRPEG